MKKLKIICTLGLPASGKSFWAKQFIKDNQSWKIVNKDLLRLMLDDSKWSGSNEKFVLKVRDSIIRTSLENGYNIIVDDTNLNDKHYNHIKEVFGDIAEVSIQDFTHISLEECLLRDSKRQNYVGEKVIRQMWNKYLKPKPEKIEFNPKLQTVTIVDCDGTLCLFDRDKKNPFDRDFENDELNQAVAKVISHRNIILVSGRDEKFRNQTMMFLEKHPLPINFLGLFMRKTGDSRKDTIVKEEIYENEIKGKYNVELILDDRASVVSFWRFKGLTCFQVAEGDF